MFLFPAGCLLLVLFVLFFPIVLLLLFFNVVTFGFENLGISPGLALTILFLMLVASLINIPVSRRTVEHYREINIGWFRRPVERVSGLSVNLGGAIIPTVISGYLLFKVPLLPALYAILPMIVICKLLTRPVRGRGLVIPMFIPPVFATIFAILFAGQFAAPTAYIAGVLGTLIGGDLLNLSQRKKIGNGIISIGGAGVFDGIFLVGIFAVLLTAISMPIFSPPAPSQAASFVFWSLPVTIAMKLNKP